MFHFVFQSTALIGIIVKQNTVHQRPSQKKRKKKKRKETKQKNAGLIYF